MKYLFSLSICLISAFTWAGPVQGNFYLDLSAENSLETIVSAVERQLDLPEDQHLALNTKIEYSNRTHLTFKHMLADREVLFSGLNMHFYSTGKIYVQAYLVETNIPASSLRYHTPYLIIDENGLFEVNRFEAENEILYVDEKGRVIVRTNKYLYFKDTTIKAKVFLVNPLNSANKTYGGDFKDNGDQSNSALENEQYEVDMHAEFRNDSFFLNHPMFEFKEISAPYHNDEYGTDTAVWNYLRSDPRFEAANAYYHLTTFHDYLVGLGFGPLIRKVQIDVHAMNNSDNSQFDPNKYTIEFGDGGVDDAEDGEVVIHEYVHSLSTTAMYTENNGKQRAAMEEGNCDYLSKSYSRSINDNNSYKVFSWDGHNEYWNGFSINSADHYPENLTNSKDGDRDMWSSTLMCISDYIGREATDSLVIEHFSYQTQYATMPDMAEILLHVDSTLFNGRYYEPIKHCLVMRGLAKYGASVEEVENSLWQVKNSMAFMEGSGSLSIELSDVYHIRLYNASGQLIDYKQNVSELSLDPQNYVKGLYIVEIYNAQSSHTLKIVR